MMNYLGLILLVVISIICLVLCILLSNIKNNINLDKQENRLDLDGFQNIITKRDCSSETVYSINDAQCNQACYGNVGQYVSQNGICINSLILQSSVIEKECDPKKGVIAYLIGNTQTGQTSLKCLSVDLGIQSNDPDGPNVICQNGSIDIDYLKEFPQIENCKCMPSDVVGLIPYTTSIRQHASCVSLNLYDALKYNDLII
ncbi:per os infectivity factor 3 [Gryllus bimaculatus nudivirus]|uniref:Per os infectivity factor 3 n=1 Tax=Gryllus bimaculatus nudivirus TaxID=432587 RepID=A4L1W6_9VIRU|nr:per os infectivity factor 3 [Gryllus bimaculatus nudivirus]ABO45336.1 per os infectivity factor 3 [Gryllus bimaculatus nudivirus]